MGKRVRSHMWQLIALATALLLVMGVAPGLSTITPVMAQSDDLRQTDWDDLVDEATSDDPAYGPEEGELDHDPERVTFDYADVELADFYVSVTFENPYAASSGQFDYGIQFRGHDDDGEARFLRFILISDGTWGLTDGTEEVLETDVYADIDDSRRGENSMAVYAEGDVVHLAINGDYIGTFDVPFDTEGEIAVGTSFLAESFEEDEATAYLDFTIWELGGGNGRQDPEDETPEPEEDETPRGDDDEETPEPEEDETPSNGDDPEIDGTEYESSTYGYSIVFDDTWEVTNEESTADGDILELSNGPSSLQIVSFESSDTPGECIEAVIDSLSSDESIESVEIATDNNDEELIGEDDEQAFVVLFVTYTTDEGSVDFTAFYQCIAIADGDAMLQITHLALADAYNDEIENRVAVLESLDLEGSGGNGGGGDEEETPEADETEETTDLPEGSVTFLLDPVGDSSDLIFGTLIPDGDATTVELLALTSETGDFEVTIHEGSCRQPGEPAFELGPIDATGLLDASIDATVEDLTNGDFVMIVSDGGDFEEAAIACGVLEEIPVEEEE